MTTGCEDISYSIGREPGKLDDCLCEIGFEWVEKSCLIICEMEYALDKVDEAIDQCNCLDGYLWN